MHLGLSVCMSVQTRNSTTITLIDLIFLHKKYYTHGPVLKDDRDPDLDSRIYFGILHQNMPSKYAMTSNVHYYEIM